MSEADDGPNVLWICTDQQRFDTLGCYGNDWVETPNIDQLAADGVRFDRCFSQSPVCTPSRASFLTGRYPRTTRVRQNGQNMPEGERLVTAMLADEGYTCGLSGKLHISAANPGKDDRPMMEQRIDDGYAQFNWSHDTGTAWPTNEYHQWLDRKGVEYTYDQVRDADWVYTGPDAAHQQTTWCAEKAEDFIRANEEQDRPWLFSVNPYDPHLPFDPAREYLERYLDRLEDVPLPAYEEGELEDKTIFQRRDHEGALMASGARDRYPFPEMDEEEHRLIRAAYWAMIDLIDDQVGRLLDALEETGQREDTIVVFMSDHGEMLGDHGIYLKGPYFYEPQVRVPLVMAGPGIESGVDSDALVELTDVAPTLCDLTGIEQHEGMQGESVADILAGASDPDRHRESVYSEFYNAKPGHEDPMAFDTMVRTDRYKLVSVHGRDDGELYDLQADPGEHDNLWDDPEYADVKTDMLKLMTDRMAETCDPLPPRVAGW